MLKIISVKLELISYNDMYLFVEKCMRCGISYIGKRYSKANNKYIKSYDDSKRSKYITYLDANKLFGWALSQYLPYSGFKWLNRKEIDRFDVNSVSENSLDRYILEVDLEYRDELHESHNHYPITPEKLEIIHRMLSKYCSDILNEYNIKVNNKLVPKGRYVLHYGNLELHMSLKIKLISVHEILEFKQSDWLKKYIDFNTNKRNNAVSSFDKIFF